MKKLIVLILTIVMIISIFAGCGKCEHEYTEATCTKRAVCTKCGEESGDVLAHDYSSATCSSPAKCKMCGVTTGTARKHSTDFGKCSYCKEKINYQLYSNIKTCLDLAEGWSDSVIAIVEVASYFTTASQYKAFIETAIEYYEQEEIQLNKAYNLCGDYPELSTLKKEIKEAKESLPLSWSGQIDKNSLIGYINDCKTFVYAEADVKIEWLNVENLFK